MNMLNRQRARRQRFSVSLLQAHPVQSKVFFGDDAGVVDRLRTELATGLQPPIHVLADGTVVRGCLWFRAAVLEGLEEVLVTVRHDLPGPQSPAAIRELVDDSLRSRAASDLEKAACYHQLRQQPQMPGPGDLRDRIATEMNCGLRGRTLDRLSRLLSLPLPIKEAIADGRLTQAQGEQIRLLTIAEQNRIASEISANTNAPQVLRRFANRLRTSVRNPQAELNKLLARLKKVLPVITDNEAHIVLRPEDRFVAVAMAKTLTRMAKRTNIEPSEPGEEFPPLPANVRVRSVANG